MTWGCHVMCPCHTTAWTQTILELITRDMHRMEQALEQATTMVMGAGYSM